MTIGHRFSLKALHLDRGRNSGKEQGKIRRKGPVSVPGVPATGWTPVSLSMSGAQPPEAVLGERTLIRKKKARHPKAINFTLVCPSGGGVCS
jgi:hypothetical protein